MLCPKCGEPCYRAEVKRLSALSYNYDYCSSPICNWDNEAEQKEAVKSEYPELFQPIALPLSPTEDYKYPEGWEKFTLGNGRTIEWILIDEEAPR